MDEKIKIVEVPDISKGLDKYLEKKKEEKEVCEHKGGSHISYFTHHEIERKRKSCEEKLKEQREEFLADLNKALSNEYEYDIVQVLFNSKEKWEGKS